VSRASEPHPGDWYEIRIKGHLADRWAAWLDGELLHSDDGTTLVRAQVPDQAALHGLLTKLRDLGLTLLSVAQAERGSAVPPSSEAPLTQNRSTP
jgi:hypothetical protein